MSPAAQAALVSVWRCPLEHSDQFPDLPGSDSAIDNPGSEDYAMAARYALKLKNLRRAIEQIAAALALDPLSQSYLGLLEQILAASRARLQLTSIDGESAFFGMAAVRARVLAQQGEFTEALRLLGGVFAFRPAIPYLEWTREWTKSAGAAKQLAPEDIAELLIAMVDVDIEPSNDVVTASVKRNFFAVGALAEQVSSLHPRHAALTIARSRLSTVLGQHTQALQLLAAEPTCPKILAELARLSSDRGDLVAARAACARAATMPMNDRAELIELAALQLELGEAESATSSFGRANSMLTAPLLSAACKYSQWLASRDQGSANEVHRLATEHEGCRWMSDDIRAYAENLVDPCDPVVPVIRHALNRANGLPVGASARVRIRTRRPLAPSARLAYLLGLQRLGRDGDMLTTPDNNAALTLGPLWQDNGNAIAAALQQPDCTILEPLRELALTPFSLADWGRQWRLITSRDCPPIPALVAAAVNPTLPPDSVHPIEWVSRWQVATAIAIASHTCPWSERADALLLLLAGEDDWVSVGAALALMLLAQSEPEATEFAVRHLRRMAEAGGAAERPNARVLAFAGMALTSGADARSFIRLRVQLIAERLSNSSIGGIPD